MLEDEEVLAVSRYWAKRLSTKYASFNELVNEGYIVGKKLKSPKLLHKWIKWTLIHYTQQEWLARILDVTSREADTGSGNRRDSIDKLVVDESFDFGEFAQLHNDLMDTINKVCNEEEKRLIHMRFWRDMTYRQIAKVENLPFQTIFYRAECIVRKLKVDYERKTK